jgi:hypothetical protein
MTKDPLGTERLEEAPLSTEHLETARRVLAEARKGRDELDEARTVEFAADLKELWEEYEGHLINAADPQRKLINQQLGELQKACRRFLRDIKPFDEKGRPGISYVQSAADEWLEEKKSERSQVELELKRLQQAHRRDHRAHVERFERDKLLSMGWPPPRTRRKRPLSPTVELRGRVQALDQDIQFLEQHRAGGTVTDLGRGAALLSQWINKAFEIERARHKDGLPWFDAPRDDPDYAPAHMWLIMEGIPQLYATYFDPEHDFGWSRDKGTRKPCGPLIDFEVAILSAFRVRSPETGMPFGLERIGQLLAKARRA